MFTLDRAIEVGRQVHPVDARQAGAYGIPAKIFLDLSKIRFAQLIDNVLFHADSFSQDFISRKRSTVSIF